jgi:hypothetical protein
MGGMGRYCLPAVFCLAAVYLGYVYLTVAVRAAAYTVFQNCQEGK